MALDTVSCGLGSLRPQWLLRFANERSFMAVYGLLGTIQTTAFMYFVATLTTLEKRFRIPSKTTGIMMTGNEISQIVLSLVLSYYGGHGNRPLWIACGVALSGLSCFILALPHFIFGPGNDALNFTKEHSIQLQLYNSSFVNPETSDDSTTSVILVFLSQFVLGIGNTVYYALGQTYLDDNTQSTRTPMMLGCVMSLRVFGPALGFILGYMCLSIYVDPTRTPTITRKHPMWIGAWWLGWIVLGLAMILFSVLIAMFPRQLPKNGKERRRIDSCRSVTQICEEEPLQKKHCFDDFIPNNPVSKKKVEIVEERPQPSLKDFKSSLKGILKNSLLMCNNVASIFYILGASGYINFSIKYMETQFQQTAARANIVAGVMSIFAMVAGFLLSGYFISRFRPRALKILSWNVVVGIVYILAEVILIFVKCPVQPPVTDGACRNLTQCASVKFNPVCYEPLNQTFLSACHAGCPEKYEVSNGTDKLFYESCSCLEEKGVLMTPGTCLVECSDVFTIFIVLMFCMHFIGSTGKIGNVLVNYRAVAPKDKPFAAGLTLLMISLFAFIPGPILFGSIIDSSCEVWNIKDGKESGNCWQYDRDKFRLYLNLTAGILTTIGVLFDCVVCYLGRNLEFYEEKDNRPDSNR